MEPQTCTEGLPSVGHAAQEKDQEALAQKDKGASGGARCTEGGMERGLHVRQPCNGKELQGIQPYGRLQQGGTLHERELLHAGGTGRGVPQGGHRGIRQAFGHPGGQRSGVPLQGVRELLRSGGHRDKIHTTGETEPERVYRKVQQDLSRGRAGRAPVQGHRGSEHGDRTLQGGIQPVPSPQVAGQEQPERIFRGIFKGACPFERPFCLIYRCTKRGKSSVCFYSLEFTCAILVIEYKRRG